MFILHDRAFLGVRRFRLFHVNNTVFMEMKEDVCEYQRWGGGGQDHASKLVFNRKEAVFYRVQVLENPEPINENRSIQMKCTDTNPRLCSVYCKLDQTRCWVRINIVNMAHRPPEACSCFLLYLLQRAHYKPLVLSTLTYFLDVLLSIETVHRASNADAAKYFSRKSLAEPINV